MAKIVYRSSSIPSSTTTGSSTAKGSGLTNAEIDQNFYNVATELASVVSTVASGASSTDTTGNTLVIRSGGNFSAGTITASLTGVASKATNLVGGNGTTLLGSIAYQSGTDTTTLLGPNTTSTKKFLRQTGTGTNGAAPAWDTLVNGDIPSALSGKTYEGLTLTANTTGFQIAGGTTPVTAVFGSNGTDVTFTGLASKATILATARTVSITGDLSYTSGSFDGSGNITGTGTLATVNTSSGIGGSFGSSTSIPILTVNGKGLVTAISTASVSTTITLAGGGATSGSVAGGGTLTFTGSSGITTSVSTSTVTFSPTSGYNGYGARTVQAIASGIPSNSTGADGDIIYQY